MRAALAAAAPPPRQTIAEWADAHRRLSPESSAEPGRWLTRRAEYQRGIMDAISDPAVDRVVVMSSAQVGKTEMINNVVGFHVDADPAPLLVVQPTLDMAETWSKDRLAPMVRDTPRLRDKIAPARTRDSGNTLLHKKFRGGHITIVGANSAAGLASRPIRVVLADEVDRYPASAGAEGDPLSLAVKRTATFWNRKIVMVSTPTIRGASRIEAAWEESDQRRFLVPCGECGEEQALEWKRVRWPEGRPSEAVYECAGCGAEWTDADRWRSVARGRWVAGNEGSRIAGFHLSELYSPWRRLGETAEDFEAVRRSPDRLRTWVNTSLGETWVEASEAPEWERLSERRERWPADEVPAGALLLTAGVDVQGDRLECGVWGWGRELESWAVAHEVVDGSPADPETWRRLEEVMARRWRHELGGEIGISRVAVDSGYESTLVYGFVRKHRGGGVVAVKGEEGWNRSAPVSGPTWVDATVGARKVRRGAQLWTVATSTLKVEFYRQLRTPAPTADEEAEGLGHPPGFVHMPHWAGAEWFRQLTAESLVTVRQRNGRARQEWQKDRERNEVLDCRIYARSAAWIAGADRWGEREWDQLRRSLEVTGPQRRARRAAEVDPSRGRDGLRPQGGEWIDAGEDWLG